MNIPEAVQAGLRERFQQNEPFCILSYRKDGVSVKRDFKKTGKKQYFVPFKMGFPEKRENIIILPLKKKEFLL
ncbi:MAG: hypothetical protein E7029_07035 [Planctomycetaceae bacterium]|nr:hypothetical protein [Planctomycetaceae bacterium]